MKKVRIGLSILFCISMVSGQYAYSQGSPDYTGGLKVKLNESGTKYFRMISWAQIQANYQDNVAADQSNISFNLRRARVLMYSQITDKFLILTHFGLNSLMASNMSPVGKGDAAQLFFHDVWGQYNIAKNHTIGAGLHYFNGISRLNNQSTLNMLTLDNNRQSWSTIGLSDQFARHLGVFGKGSFGKLQYRVSVNQAIVNGLDSRAPMQDTAVYTGANLLGSKTAGFTYSGYFEYQLLDKESNFLPYKVGSYLGAKKVLNIGAGFFAHPNGSVRLSDAMGTDTIGDNVALISGDVFYEAPLGENGAAISLYGTYQMNNYGQNYKFSAYGTGDMFYGHLGYVIPGAIKNARFQPYLSYNYHTYDGVAADRSRVGVGLNAYFSGHHSKLTVEYSNETFGASQTNLVSVQAMIYL